MNKRVPTEIRLNQKTCQLVVTFDDAVFEMTCEYLRVYSPSAEVKGHGPGQEVLQIGKQQVTITNIEMMGNYAVKLVFSDGHDSGIYSWETLYDLGKHQQQNWSDYMQRLQQAGASRQPMN